MKVTDNYVFFYSYKDMFSNHFKSPVPFSLPRHEGEGVSFYTGEHMMMYEKAMLFGDEWTAKAILLTHRPQEAKMLGRGVRGFIQEVWDENKTNIMDNVCTARLISDPSLRQLAINHKTAGRKFVEASGRDKIWGVGLEENNPLILDESNWRGLNLLGESWDRSVSWIMETLYT